MKSSSSRTLCAAHQLHFLYWSYVKIFTYLREITGKKKKKKRDEGEKTELEKNCIIPALGTVKHTFLITVPKSCYLKNM